jgi:hypothetical protein
VDRIAITHVPHEKRRRTCGTMPWHWRQVRISPDYRARMRTIETEIAEYLRKRRRQEMRSGILRIPVVVHVVYNTPQQNVTDAQIQSQIGVLNEDYRRLNADASQVPNAFAGVAADLRIEFGLAVRDPDCNATSGITRTQTAVALFSPNDNVKAAATGGHDPWPRDQYLNIWVCRLTYLGYATYPGADAAVDGVVIDYEAFGNTGTADPPYHLGRTATHEIGHWLDLLHIWGDDAGACTGSDNVADTPNQADKNFGCPAFPHVSCGNGPNGDMFMNYMDYVDDSCMCMFTAGQGLRVEAVLHTTRNQILASDGLVPPPAITGVDLWSKDNADDDGTEPNPSTLAMYISDDIWVRRQNDGIVNQEHENPEYREPGEPQNCVYVRVRNRGCSGSAQGTVKLYWAKASPGLSWPAPWDGSVTTPALMGGSIGEQPVAVNAREDEILMFPWSPPNPADYASFGADQSHFCLLSRIETSPTAPYGMTHPEGPGLYANVQNNNNIVWKNITVVDEVPGRARIESVTVANFTREILPTSLLFISPREEIPSIFDWGQVIVEFDEKLAEMLSAKEVEPVGIKRLDKTTLLIAKSGASVGYFDLDPLELHTIRIGFVPFGGPPKGVHVMSLDVIQRAKDTTIGGQRFVLKLAPDPKAKEWDQAAMCFDGVSWVDRYPKYIGVVPCAVDCPG